MDDIGVGLIGTGFMGKCHAMAFGAVKAVFAPPIAPRLAVLCDIEPAAARRAAPEFGFARWTTDWRDLVNDPAVGLVAITAPNALHREMAMAAATAGKAIYCEKPMALTLEDAAPWRGGGRRRPSPPWSATTTCATGRRSPPGG